MINVGRGIYVAHPFLLRGLWRVGYMLLAVKCAKIIRTGVSFMSVSRRAVPNIVQMNAGPAMQASNSRWSDLKPSMTLSLALEGT